MISIRARIKIHPQFVAVTCYGSFKYIFVSEMWFKNTERVHDIDYMYDFSKYCLCNKFFL